MTGGSLWQKSRVRLSDLPTLQQMLGACDQALFERVIVEDFACRNEAVSEKRRARMHKRLGRTLKAMASLSADAQDSGNRILMPRESYVLNASQRTIQWAIHADMVPVPTSDVMGELLHASKGYATTYHQAKKAQKRLEALAQTAPYAALFWEEVGSTRVYAFDPWEDTLGCRVWLGGGWCSRERYVALASAFWEMTFFGFEYDKVQARSAQEKAKLLGGVKKPKPHVSKQPLRKGNGECSANTWGLRYPDHFSEEAHDSLAKRVAILNHNARHNFFERLLDLAIRMEGSAK